MQQLYESPLKKTQSIQQASNKPSNKNFWKQLKLGQECIRKT